MHCARTIAGESDSQGELDQPWRKVDHRRDCRGVQSRAIKTSFAFYTHNDEPAHTRSFKLYAPSRRLFWSNANIIFTVFVRKLPMGRLRPFERNSFCNESREWLYTELETIITSSIDFFFFFNLNFFIAASFHAAMLMWIIKLLEALQAFRFKSELAKSN